MVSPSSSSQLNYCLTNGGFNYEQYYYYQQQQKNGGVFDDDDEKKKNKNNDNNKKKKKKIVDRHSKIWTAQGVRDRRVRLSVEIAQEFFHLQDMLGFDRASKTLEWLLANSRNAINDLLAAPNNNNNPQHDDDDQIGAIPGLHLHHLAPNPTGSAGLPTTTPPIPIPNFQP